jgi:transposase
MSEGGKVAVQADDQVVSASENRALKKRVRVVGAASGEEDNGGGNPQGRHQDRARKTLIARAPLSFEEDFL